MRDNIKLTSKSLEVSGPGAVKVAMAWFGLRALMILAGVGTVLSLGATQAATALPALAALLR